MGGAREMEVYRLGTVAYGRALALQERLVEARLRNDVPDVLLLLEHEEVITLGRSGKRAHVLLGGEALKARGVEVVETGRGGDATFHGPGQLVAYPIVDLGARRDVRRFVWGLEEVMLRVVGGFGISAGRIPGLNGAWVGERKIGALGVRVRRWVTMHGMALNVSVDLGGFEMIVPCGIRDRGVTSLRRELGSAPTMEGVQEATVEAFGQVYERRMVLGEWPPGV